MRSHLSRLAGHVRVHVNIATGCRQQHACSYASQMLHHQPRCVTIVSNFPSSVARACVSMHNITPTLAIESCETAYSLRILVHGGVPGCFTTLPDAASNRRLLSSCMTSAESQLFTCKSLYLQPRSDQVSKTPKKLHDDCSGRQAGFLRPKNSPKYTPQS